MGNEQLAPGLQISLFFFRKDIIMSTRLTVLVQQTSKVLQTYSYKLNYADFP